MKTILKGALAALALASASFAGASVAHANDYDDRGRVGVYGSYNSGYGDYDRDRDRNRGYSNYRYRAAWCQTHRYRSWYWKQRCRNAYRVNPYRY